MRLGHLTGWGLQRHSGGTPTRLVVYSDRQKEPVYVSEQTTGPDPEFTGIDFTRLGPAGRTSLLLARVFVQKDGEWTLASERELDLRDAQGWFQDNDFGKAKGPIVVFRVQQHWMWISPKKKNGRQPDLVMVLKSLLPGQFQH